jgi:DNA-directed RNA polymerase sigma subunit (sigma70/sigma32)
MDRKQMERYLKMYPELDNELERLQGDLKYYAAEKMKYQSMKLPEEQKKNMLQTIEGACAACAKEIQEVMKARFAIERTFRDISPLQKEIIQRRFWSSKGRPDTWEMLGDKLCFHPVYLKRLFKDVMDRILSVV